MSAATCLDAQPVACNGEHGAEPVPRLARVTTTTRGFAVACPDCGEKGTLRVDLNDTSSLSCWSCETEFTTEYVRDLLATWTNVLAWLESAPSVE